MTRPTANTSPRARALTGLAWTLVALAAAMGLADWIIDGFGTRRQGPEVAVVYAMGLLALVMAAIGLVRVGSPRCRLAPRPGAIRPLGLPMRDWVFSLVFAVTAAPGLWALRNWASAVAFLDAFGK